MTVMGRFLDVVLGTRCIHDGCGRRVRGRDLAFHKRVHYELDALRELQAYIAASPARIAEAIKQGAAQGSSRGRCGHVLEGFRNEGRQLPAEHCALPAGHPGWHKADSGSEWSA